MGRFLQGAGPTRLSQRAKRVVRVSLYAGKVGPSLPSAAHLVGRNVDVIGAATGYALQAAMETTKTVPVVFFGVTDPVALGYVASLAKPGGNVTGVASMGIELNLKRLPLTNPGSRRGSPFPARAIVTPPSWNACRRCPIHLSFSGARTAARPSPHPRPGWR